MKGVWVDAAGAQRGRSELVSPIVIGHRNPDALADARAGGECRIEQLATQDGICGSQSVATVVAFEAELRGCEPAMTMATAMGSRFRDAVDGQTRELFTTSWPRTSSILSWPIAFTVRMSASGLAQARTLVVYDRLCQLCYSIVDFRPRCTTKISSKDKRKIRNECRRTKAWDLKNRTEFE